jgi:hypothetical protein
MPQPPLPPPPPAPPKGNPYQAKVAAAAEDAASELTLIRQAIDRIESTLSILKERAEASYEKIKDLHA